MKRKGLMIVVTVLVLGILVGCTGKEASMNLVLKVGLESTYPPFNYETEDGELTGYDVEVAKEIGKRIGYQIEFVPTKWSGIFGALEAGKFDMIVNQVTITPERQKKYAFTVPYVVSGAQLIVSNATNDITSLEDLKGRRVGVGLGSNYEQIVTNYDQEQRIQVKTYEVLLDTLNDLAIGRIDAALNDKLVAAMNIQKTGLDLKIAGQPVQIVENAIAFREKGELFEKVDQALRGMKADGTLREISVKWFGVDVSQ